MAAPAPAGKGGLRPGRRRPGGRVAAALLIALAASAVALSLWLPGALDGLEDWSFDLRERAFPGKADPGIVMVALDQDSLDWAAARQMGWPWYREYYSYLLDFCAGAGAASVAFDVVFTEPSVYGPEEDEGLAASMSSYGRYVGAVQLGNHQGKERAWPDGLKRPLEGFPGEADWLARYGASAARPRASFNAGSMDASAAMVGNVDSDPDKDGVFRRMPPLASFGGVSVPCLGLASAIVGGGAAAPVYEKGRLSWGGSSVPLDGGGNAILRFRGPAYSHVTYRARDLIQSQVNLSLGEAPLLDPALLKGKRVFFGFTATGLNDLKTSPWGGKYPGMEVHATFLDDLLHGDFISEPPRPLAALYLALLTAAAGLALVLSRRTWSQVLAACLSLCLPVGLAFLAYLPGLWLPLVPALLAVILELVGTSVYAYRTEGRQKAFIKGAFRQYLSPVVIEQLIADPARLHLGGERRELSMYFSDVQGFTSISEKLDPEDLTALLNDYLSAMSDIILEEGGTIDKYEGDAIIAFWNAPLDLPDHALRSVRAALRCQAELERLRPAFRSRSGKDLRQRIGLNSGPAVVGNMGSKNRFDYTMLGDAVNLAARLEGVNKQFGTYTMISRATFDLLGGAFPCRELSRIAVVGKSEPVVVYEPLTEGEWKSREGILETFARGLSAYYAGDFRKALESFSAIAAQDPPAARYVERCGRLMAAPPAEWDGVWTMTEK